MINCIKVTDLLANKVLVITAGEDEFIRVWDTSFNMIHEVNVRKAGDIFEEVKYEKNLSV